MEKIKRILRLYKKTDSSEIIEEMHKRLMKGLSQIDAPLGLKESEIPKTPDFGTGLVAVYYTKNIKTKGVEIRGSYSWRGIESWDDLFYEFKSTYKLINYEEMINIDLPKVIELFKPYIAEAYIPYAGAYEEGTTPETRTYKGSINPAYLYLKSIGINPGELGKNLFTLQPVMYFSGEMCKEVIKLSRDEIIKRLEGKVQKVFSLLDGVYIILSDKVEMSYPEFKEMNDTFKPMLGLI